MNCVATATIGSATTADLSGGSDNCEQVASSNSIVYIDPKTATSTPISQLTKLNSSRL